MLTWILQKKKFKDLYLPAEWPHAAVVSRNFLLSCSSLVVNPRLQRDAYYHPTVDSSEEPFKWGLPDLDALRQ
jgi:DNA excision repair protein ERCC-5